VMKRIGFVLIAFIIPNLLLVPTQEKMTILEFDQHYELLPTGNLLATWELTIVPAERVKSMLLHAFFSKKAYVKDVVVSDAEGSLNSRMISREDVPLLEVNFREELSLGAEYHFKCILEVWKAVDIGETEGSFTLLTGYNFPVEELNITTQLPEGTKLRSFFPADGTVSAGKHTEISWSMSSLPSGYNIQISVSFAILSEDVADDFFSDGKDFYDMQNFENAREKFEQAQEIYESLNLQEKADQCRTYMDRIEGLEEGLPLFREAVVLYDSKKYAEALAKFREVKSIYEEHQISAEEVDSYISDCTTYIDAYAELQEAETYLEEGKKREAKDHFNRAKTLFSHVQDAAMVAQIDARLEETEEDVDVPDTTEGGNPLAMIGIVVIVAAVGAGLLMKLRKPAPVYTEEAIREEMRQLKAQFVYGEINKKQYEEQLAKLEKELQALKSA
jgi:tetratricopeptide (TPR) repeat protein